MNVEIWSDVVCPWCYIGKRRFETALAGFAHRDDVEVVWRSFELDPSAPRTQPGTLNDMLARKYGTTPTQAAAMNARVSTEAAGEGLDYHLEQARPGNTFDAHRLLHLAADRGLQGALKERLMKAYFTEGLAVGEPEALIPIAVEVGLNENEARAVLAGDAYAEAARADEQRAAAFGIRGVPFVVIDEKYGVSGAQPAAAFLDVLNQAWAASRPLTMVGGTAGADACEGDSCAVPTRSTGTGE
jgi:predicted DsbA family dithiol-disulfide isomerase